MRRNWDKVVPLMYEQAPLCSSFTELCKELNVPKSSGFDELRRRGIDISELKIGSANSVPYIKTTQTNTATVASNNERVKTLEQLLAVAEVDLDVWEVERHVINKWEVGAKQQDISLDYTNGKPSGHVIKKGIIVEPLWQVKAWLRRIEPIALFPTIQPVTCLEEWPLMTATPQKGRLSRAFLVPDPHFGFIKDRITGELIPLHNEEVLSITLELIEATKPDRILLLGDILDLADWSDKYFRAPEVRALTQPAIIAAHKYAKAQRNAAPDAEITWIRGNHGERMRKQLINHLLASYDLRAADEMELPPALSLPKLLALHKLGIHWVDRYPEGEVWLNDALRVSHGEVTAASPGGGMGKLVDRSDVCEITGHTHKLELVSGTKKDRKGMHVTQAFSPGCTCWIDGRVPSGTTNIHWQNGCGIVDYEPAGTYFNITPILINEGRAIYDRRVYTARS